MERTEKQKMLAGELSCEDPELTAKVWKARRLLRQYNSATEEQPELQYKISQELFSRIG